MSIVINVLNTPVVWPTQGDINYSNGTTQFVQLVSTALNPIKGLYNTTTGQVGNLAFSDLGQLTLNGVPVISGVSSFNGRTGDITLLSSDVVTALGYTPADAAGVVTSVGVSGGTTGLITTGGPITSSGTITLGGVLGIGSGGTGTTTANGALNNLLPAQAGNASKWLFTNGTTTSWVDPLPVQSGNTGKILGTDGTSTSWIPNVGAQGGPNNPIIFENDIHVTANYTMTTGKNGVSAGPIIVDPGFAVTVPSGSVWTIA
jgi:hypothetical protein